MSLRTRLLLGVAVVGLALVLATVSITRATEHHLVDQVDQQLTRSTPEGRGERDADDGWSDESYGGPSRPSPTRSTPPSSVYMARIDPTTGELVTVMQANLLTASSSAPAVDAEEAVAKVGSGPFTVDSVDGSLRYRVLVQEQSNQTVLFALPLQNVDESIHRLLLIQGLAAAAILGTLGLTTFWVLRLGVRPVKVMTESAKAIGEGDLSHRIPGATPGTEAGELGVALNQMLGRIEEAFDERARSEDRLRQFVADASHELRTPVTTIRGYAELYRLGGLAEQNALDEAMRRTEQEAARMGQLVGDLLDLARLDQGRPLQLGQVDVAQVVADGAADLRAVDPDRPVEVAVPEHAVVIADESLVRQIVANLTTNARVHTPAGTQIDLRVEATDGGVVLEVADHGPGMAPDVAARAFERFYRADPARARQTGGSGLGLAIVAGGVAALGGTIDLDTQPGHGTRIRVSLPSIPPTAPPGDDSHP